MIDLTRNLGPITNEVAFLVEKQVICDIPISWFIFSSKSIKLDVESLISECSANARRAFCQLAALVGCVFSTY